MLIDDVRKLFSKATIATDGQEIRVIYLSAASESGGYNQILFDVGNDSDNLFCRLLEITSRMAVVFSNSALSFRFITSQDFGREMFRPMDHQMTDAEFEAILSESPMSAATAAEMEAHFDGVIVRRGNGDLYTPDESLFLQKLSEWFERQNMPEPVSEFGLQRFEMLEKLAGFFVKASKGWTMYVESPRDATGFSGSVDLVFSRNRGKSTVLSGKSLGILGSLAKTSSAIELSIDAQDSLIIELYA